VTAVTIQFIDGTEEEVSHSGPWWTWREFVCYHPADRPDQVAYVPLARIERLVTT
jgi:hypothetical protein